MRLGDDLDAERGEPDPIIGTKIGPLAIVRRLGTDRTGKLYVAEHEDGQTQRMVKILSPHLTENPMLVRRFITESRVVGWLGHRNVLRIHDVGQLPTGACYTVHDHVGGQSLRQFMATHAAPIPPHIVVHIVCEIANGLQAAHARRVLHRDLTPENVVVVETESDPYHSLLLGLAVAELGDDVLGGPQTRSGIVIGTPAYMSAEQLRGDPMTISSDVF